MGGLLSGNIDENPDLEKFVDIADGFRVKIRWLSPKARDEIAKLCTEYKRGIPDVNRERHARAYTKRVVRGWEGLTVDILTGPLKIAINSDSVPKLKLVEKENGGSLPFNQDDSALIYLNALPDKYANKIKDAMDEWDDDVGAQEEEIEKK